MKNARAQFHFVLALAGLAIACADTDPERAPTQGVHAKAPVADPVRVETFDPQELGTLSPDVVSYLQHASSRHRDLDLSSTSAITQQQAAWERAVALTYESQPQTQTLDDRRAVAIAQIELFARASAWSQTQLIAEPLLDSMAKTLAPDETIVRSDAAAKVLVLLGDQAALRDDKDASMRHYMRAIRLLDQLRRHENAAGAVSEVSP